MLPSLDYSTAYLAILVLLALSGLTIEFCRRDLATPFRDEEEYLFHGKTPAHAFTSNIGATFSVTFFLGATMVFSNLLHVWSGIAVILCCVMAYLCYRRLLDKVHGELSFEIATSQRGNILFSLFEEKFSEPVTRSLANLYVVIYLGLLAEEIAASRALLVSVVPGRPIIASAFLLILCLVILVYLRIGGFRAVLVSDFVQVVVLSAFALLLLYLVLKSDFSPASFQSASRLPNRLLFANIFFPCVLGVAWFLGGVDFASRLNFELAEGNDLKQERVRLVRATFAGTALLLLIGVLFGHAVHEALSPTVSPNSYLRALSTLFLTNSARITQIIFLASVFCMMFTTLDTLMITMVQSGHYTKKKFLQRRFLPQLLIVGAAVSLLPRTDNLYVFGIFGASMLVLPTFYVCGIIFPSLARVLPRSPLFLWLAFVLTWLVYLGYGNQLAEQSEVQFLIPGIPLLSGVVFMGAQKVFESKRRILS